MDLRDPQKKPDGLVWNYGNLCGKPTKHSFLGMGQTVEKQLVEDQLLVFSCSTYMPPQVKSHQK